MEEFYQGPEIGLIRVKEVGCISAIVWGEIEASNHGGFARKDEDLTLGRSSMEFSWKIL